MRDHDIADGWQGVRIQATSGRACGERAAEIVQRYLRVLGELIPGRREGIDGGQL